MTTTPTASSIAGTRGIFGMGAGAAIAFARSAS